VLVVGVGRLNRIDLYLDSRPNQSPK